MRSLGDVELTDLTPARIRAWRKELLEAGTGAPTVAGAYRFLHAVLNTAVDEEDPPLIRRNPCRIKGAASDRSPERPTASIAEVFAIADAIRPWWRCLVLLAAFCSLRWGELIALRRRNLDLANGVVHVRIRLSEQAGVLRAGIPKAAWAIDRWRFPP